MGERKLESAAPQPTAMGTMPAPMASVVMMMGRARLWQASIRASNRFMGATTGWPLLPSLPRRATMAYSTSKIEFLVAMPISMMSPISEGIEKLLSASSKPTKAPPKDRGSAIKMVMGCKNAPNNSTSTM